MVQAGGTPGIFQVPSHTWHTRLQAGYLFLCKAVGSPGPHLEVTTSKRKQFLSIYPDLCIQSGSTAFCSEGGSVKM